MCEEEGIFITIDKKWLLCISAIGSFPPPKSIRLYVCMFCRPHLRTFQGIEDCDMSALWKLLCKGYALLFIPFFW